MRGESAFDRSANRPAVHSESMLVFGRLLKLQIHSTAMLVFGRLLKLQIHSTAMLVFDRLLKLQIHSTASTRKEEILAHNGVDVDLVRVHNHDRCGGVCLLEERVEGKRR